VGARLLTAEVCRQGDLAGIVDLSVQGAYGVVFTGKVVLISTPVTCVFRALVCIAGFCMSE
jgi:uncharacterized membrane protein